MTRFRPCYFQISLMTSSVRSIYNNVCKFLWHVAKFWLKIKLSKGKTHFSATRASTSFLSCSLSEPLLFRVDCNRPGFPWQARGRNTRTRRQNLVKTVHVATLRGILPTKSIFRYFNRDHSGPRFMKHSTHCTFALCYELYLNKKT